MPDNRQHAENPLAIGERRLSARTPVSPQAFVKFGENNYGFVFNISETGLVFAPTGPLTLAVGAVAKMRFLLPDSQDWIQTSGEVAWIADSQKEAGVRFVDLDHDTRKTIRNWISQEPSRAQPAHPRIAAPESDESAKDAARVPASTDGREVKSGTFVDGAALNSILADPAKLLRETKGAREKFAPQPGKTVSVGSLQVSGAMHVPERRSHMRRRVLSLEYIDLGSFNGGILLNLSEGGMYVQAVAGLSSDDLPQISFRLPDSGYTVKTNAQIAWTGESKKDAGIQFVNLPEEARLKIREWVALEHPPIKNANELATDAAPVRKKKESLLEMPPPGLSKKLPKPQEVSARITQTQDGALVPPLSAAPVERPAATAVELLHLSGPILQTRLGELPKISEQTNADPSSAGLVQPRSWRGLVAAIVIVVLLSFVAGWMVAGPGGRKQFLAMFERQQSPSDSAQNSSPTPTSDAPAANVPAASTASDTSQQRIPKNPNPSVPVMTTTTPDKSQPSNLNGNAQPAPTHAKGSDLSAANFSTPPTQKPAAPVAHLNSPPSTLADASRTTHPSQPSISAASNSSSAPAQNKPQEIRPTQTTPPVAASPVSSNAVKNSPSLATNSSTQPPTSTLASQSANANPNPVASQPPVHVDPPPVVAKPPAPVEVVKGTVSVSASPFPSIRVPPEMKSQVSKQGASLQLGQLISRVEPVYPEDAERQRIEGAVKLHVIIDRDGNIQNIDQMTGPPLLEAAAANAVRQWKYKPTSLGGQPVEAGVDVTVVFRLQTTHAN
ncbi:MAG TPA: TonB family protein [Candidatus Acidoferrales bacterium]|nr:TonB family protein [Candidatus Acidoferrales bacterium]